MTKIVSVKTTSGACVVFVCEECGTLKSTGLARYKRSSRHYCSRKCKNAVQPRKQQVLAALLTGQSNGQIAARLGIHTQTVKVHAGILYQEYGVQDRIQLMAKLMVPKLNLDLAEVTRSRPFEFKVSQRETASANCSLSERIC